MGKAERRRRRSLMVVDNTPKNVNNVLLENVEGYVYILGTTLEPHGKKQDKEI